MQHNSVTSAEFNMATIGKKILVIDDDAGFRQFLSEQLRLHEEFQTTEAESGAVALERVRSDYFDAILLDVGLPDMDGHQVCRVMRRTGVKAPIIMLTGADSDADTILGLDAGANDYVTKPFHLSVLLARLRVQLRHFDRSEYAVFAIGPFTFRPSDKLLLEVDTGRQIHLTDKEVRLLRFLLRADENVVARETLLNEVWNYSASVTTHTLETHVYRLRQKIETDPSEPKILITDSDGYRLIP